MNNRAEFSLFQCNRQSASRVVRAARRMTLRGLRVRSNGRVKILNPLNCPTTRGEVYRNENLRECGSARQKSKTNEHLRATSRRGLN